MPKNGLGIDIPIITDGGKVSISGILIADWLHKGFRGKGLMNVLDPPTSGFGVCKVRDFLYYGQSHPNGPVDLLQQNYRNLYRCDSKQLWWGIALKIFKKPANKIFRKIVGSSVSKYLKV